MEARIAVAKIGKYATSESGDTFEMIERPSGGLSFVLADGQSSGKSAKAISNVVARKAISLLAEGVRDGAAARAASDYLYTYRTGKVLATLNILSIDMLSQSMVVTRNNPAPVLIVRNGHVISLDQQVDPVGIRRGIRPSIHEIPLTKGLTAVVYTDGLTHAGSRRDRSMDVEASIQQLLSEGEPDPDAWTASLIEEALQLDQGRPADDISLMIASVTEGEATEVRRLSLQVPL